MRSISRHLNILMCFLLIPMLALAQEKAMTLQPAKTVKGIVIEESTGEPIIGANVYVKESMRGEVTNMEGNFTLLDVKEGQTVIVSCIGCKDWTLIYEGQDFVKVNLVEDMMELSEVVAVGYGVQERRDLTGAVGKVSAQDISGVAASFDNAMVGKVAGVNINLSSGAPGSATAITIRGLTSLQDDANNPLIVIDGVPVYGTGKKVNSVNFGNGSVAGGTIGGNSVSAGFNQEPEFERNPLSSLNPEDIESIEILKDAFATAIYGSRGAAGVILVTTKKGQAGKPQIRVGYSTSLSRPIGTPDLLSGDEYSDIYTKYYKDLPPVNGGGEYHFPTDHQTDWMDEVIRTGITNEFHASVSGGTEETKYYISINQLDQQGYIINQDYKRTSARTNIDFNPAKWITFGTNTNFSVVNNEALNSQAVYREAVLMPSNIPVYKSNGDYFYHTAAQTNPEWNINPVGGNKDNPVALANNENYAKDTRVIGNLYAELKPYSWLRLKSEVGIDLYNTRAYNRQLSKPTLVGGSASESTNQNLKYVVNNVLSVNKAINDANLLNVTLGQSFETSTESRMGISGQGFYDDDVKSISAAKTQRVTASTNEKWAVLSYFARVNYRFKDRYLLGATYRVDGSSRFNANERYMGFPSFSAGWIMTEEEFMKSVSWLNELKLRSSYGLTGLDGALGYYGNQGQWTINGNNGGLSYNGVPILEVKQIPNPNLKWETTQSFDIGFDASMFNNRIDVTFDYFYKRINNLLSNDYVPLYTGYSTQQQNIGDMQNQGIEVSLNARIIKRKDWSWTSSFNLSRSKDKILSLTEAGFQMAETGYKVVVEGEGLNLFYMYDWVGVDPMTGDPLWRWGDGTVNNVPPQAESDKSQLANRYNAGSSLPDFYGGWNNEVRFKNLDIRFSFSFSVGQKMFNGSQATLMTYHLKDAYNLSSDILDYWKIPGHETDIPKLVNNTNTYNPYGPSAGLPGYDVSRMNDRFLEDASYLRLRNVAIGYTFSQGWVKKLYMSRIRLYAQADNLFTLTNYSGIDPEVNAFGSSATLGGYDELTLPQAMSLKFGVDITF
ncbi:TonB-dependent receptor [Marinilabiliaceae bacterium JC017]|nr:TonB-dependent receptor [Marinilabiliaceae bacterium JC017]